MRKDAVERVQRSSLFELCRAWASSAKPMRNEELPCGCDCQLSFSEAPNGAQRLKLNGLISSPHCVSLSKPTTLNLQYYTLSPIFLTSNVYISPYYHWNLLTLLKRSKETPSDDGSWCPTLTPLEALKHPFLPFTCPLFKVELTSKTWLRYALFCYSTQATLRVRVTPLSVLAMLF